MGRRGYLAPALAVMVGAWPGHTAVIHTQINAVVEVATGGAEIETNLDIDGDGLSDIDFFSNQFGSTARGGFGGGSSGSAIFGRWQDDGGPAFQAVRNLAAGTVISDALEIGDGTTIGDETFENGDTALFYKSTFGGAQDFVDGAEGFMAAKFNIPGAGTTHFGWVRVLVEVAGVRVGTPPNDDPGARLTIVDGAFRDEPLAPIEAGQTTNSGTNTQRLNNLVVELVDTTVGPAAPGHDPATAVTNLSFTTDRERWVFLSLTADGAGMRVSLGGAGPDAPVLESFATGSAEEAMRWLGPGTHDVAVYVNNPELTGTVHVRTIPEIMLYPVSFAAWEKETSADFGYRKDWAFFAQHMLANANAIAFFNVTDFGPYIAEWRAEGKKVLLKENVPSLSSSPAEIYAEWGGPLEQYPELDGLTIDEFGTMPEHQALYDTWADVFDQIGTNTLLTGKRPYSFWGSSAPREEMRTLVEATQRNNFRWLHEGYYMLRVSEGDEAAQMQFIQAWGGNKFLEFQTMFPGLVESNLLYTFGVSDYHWSFDTAPELDFKVFLDMQFHHIANHPGFLDMCGVSIFSLNSTTEEISRYFSALLRHYCIEGSSERFNTDPLEVTHILNPGFEDGITHWQIQEATPGSVAALLTDQLPYYNTVTSRAIPHLDKMLRTTRSATAPNTVTQPITGLSTGRLYSLRVLVSDLTDIPTTRLLPLSLDIGGADVLPEHTMDQPWTTRFDRRVGGGEMTACWNFRHRVFRPTGSQATLTLSDWPDAGGPGGEVGHEMIWDFIEVQPYFESTGILPTTRVKTIQITTDVPALQFDSETGMTYELQFTMDPTTAVWMTTGFKTTGTGSSILAFDPGGFTTQKVYRIVQ